jgi:uncharacterized membrane protein HdeD (DUF308 family)
MPLIVDNWWSLTMRGIIAILLGIATFAWPQITVASLVLLFGGYALVDGVVNLVGAWRHSQMRDRWGALLIEGLIGVLAGLMTFVWPAITMLALTMLIAIWAILSGVFKIAAAIRLRKHIAGEWLLGLSGVASLFFGVFLMAMPLVGALAIALWFGVFALVTGVVLTVLGLRLRSWTRSGLPPMHSPLPIH